MSTEQVLLEARMAVASAQENTVMYYILALCLIGATAVALAYINERWTFIPRRKQRRMFTEKF